MLLTTFLCVNFTLSTLLCIIMCNIKLWGSPWILYPNLNKLSHRIIAIWIFKSKLERLSCCLGNFPEKIECLDCKYNQCLCHSVHKHKWSGIMYCLIHSNISNGISKWWSIKGGNSYTESPWELRLNPTLLWRNHITSADLMRHLGCFVLAFWETFSSM